MTRLKMIQAEVKSSTSIDDLDDMILTETLVRLPLKSLIHSRLVSKYWNSLITDPGFRLPPNPAVAILLCIYSKYKDGEFIYVPFSAENPHKLIKVPFAGEPWGIQIKDACNGLLICETVFTLDKWICYVYNPTTKKFSILPKLEEEKEDGIWRTRNGMMFLAFDPSKSSHYKVVRVQVLNRRDLPLEYAYQYVVYSSETGIWRKWGDHFPATHIDFNKGVYWNGAIHWLNDYSNRSSLYLNLDDISNNNNNNNNNNMQPPTFFPSPPVQYPNEFGQRLYYYFGESWGHMNYVESCQGQVNDLNLYEMKRGYSEWFVK
ncbi:hypothetical protein OROHE_024690 [Orobanche hederae]